MTCRRRWLLATKSYKKTVNKARPDSFEVYTFYIVCEYETKLTASEEEQQELLRVLEQTKRMAYARDQQISMLESDCQLMLEKCEY